MIKICEECEEPFEASRKSARWCNKIHIRECLVCGKRFEVSHRQIQDNKRCCSRRCSDILAHKINQERLSEEVRYCKECGKPFTPRNSNQKYCGDDHYRPCPICGQLVKVATIGDLKSGICRTCSDRCTRTLISKKLSGRKSEVRRQQCTICGKDFILNWPYTALTCSPKCRGEYRKRSGIAKESAKKASKTLMMRYGVTNSAKAPMKPKKCAYCGEEFIPVSSAQKWCKRDHYGPCPVCGKPTKILDMYVGPTACSKECRQKEIEATNLKKYGAPCVFQSEEIKNKIKSSLESKYGVSHYSHTNEYRQKYNSTMIDRYGVINPMQNRESHIKAAETRKSIAASDGTHLDSSYEVLVYDWLKGQGLEFDRQIPISYEYDGKAHITLVDFKVDDILLEVKGFHLLQGCFDYAPSMVPIEQKLDVYRQNDVVVVTDSQGAKILRSHHVRGIDIEVFKDNSWNWDELKSLLSVEDIFISSEVLS